MNTKEVFYTNSPAEEESNKDAPVAPERIQLGERIKEARGEASQKDFAAALGMHVNTIGKLERGIAALDVPTLLDIAALARCSAAWLLLGPPYSKHDEIISRPRNDLGLHVEFSLIPIYDIEASAGNGTAINTEEVIGRFAFKRTWLARKGLSPTNLVIITAKGDSMEPTVKDGDILLVDRNVPRLVADGIYLIERGGDLYCKRLQRLFSGGLNIMSDNTKYEPQKLDPGEAEGVNVVGRVVWIGGER